MLARYQGRFGAEHASPIGLTTIHAFDRAALSGGLQPGEELRDACPFAARKLDFELSAPPAKAELVSLELREPGRQVELVVAPGLMVDGDPELIRIALENLLGNAWKFTSRRALARIEVGKAAPEHGAPVFFVRDNGAGFDMRYAAKLFGAFQRLHAMADYPGTGIGLATVQRIMHRHGGRAWAEGVVDEGATISFTLGKGRD